MTTVSTRGRWRWPVMVGCGAALAVVLIAYGDLLLAAFATNPSAGSAQSVQRGERLWHLDCEPCHGPQGRGDGSVTAQLRRRPKDLTRIATPPVLPDGVLAYRIANGGDVMPAWKSVLSDADIWDLVSFIRAQRAVAAR